MLNRITELAPLLSAVGSLTMVIGLAWDVLLHSLDHELAAHEEIFSLGNPGHALLAAGLALSVLSTLLFAIERWQRRSNSSAVDRWSFWGPTSTQDS